MSTYLVTGANRGVGLELCKQLKERGETVLGTARGPESVSPLLSLGIDALFLDLNKKESIDELCSELDGCPIDYLINNAGVYIDHGKDIHTMDYSSFLTSQQVNALGPLFVLRGLIPNLQSGTKKICVNISSQRGSIVRSLERNIEGGISYSCSKASLNMITAIASNELKSEGISVVSVHPGWVKTDMGGDKAEILPEESASNILSIVDKVTIQDSGSFFNIDGTLIPY